MISKTRVSNIISIGLITSFLLACIAGLFFTSERADKHHCIAMIGGATCIKSIDIAKFLHNKRIEFENANAMQKQHALQQLLSEKIMERRGVDLGLALNDKAIANIIHSQTEFQSQGVFDIDKFNNYLKSGNINIGLYSKFIKNATISSMLNSVLTDVFYDNGSEFDHTIWKRNHSKHDIAYYYVDYNDINIKATPIDEDLKQIYNENKNIFITPATRTVSIVSSNELIKPIIVTDQQIKAMFSNLKTEGRIANGILLDSKLKSEIEKYIEHNERCARVRSIESIAKQMKSDGKTLNDVIANVGEIAVSKKQIVVSDSDSSINDTFKEKVFTSKVGKDIIIESRFDNDNCFVLLAEVVASQDKKENDFNQVKPYLIELWKKKMQIREAKKLLNGFIDDGKFNLLIHSKKIIATLDDVNKVSGDEKYYVARAAFTTNGAFSPSFVYDRFVGTAKIEKISSVVDKTYNPQSVNGLYFNHLMVANSSALLAKYKVKINRTVLQ